MKIYFCFRNAKLWRAVAIPAATRLPWRFGANCSRWPATVFLTLLFTVSWAQERVIRVGDVIEIVVFEHQELSRKVIISEAGTINYPFMQDLPVDGIPLSKFQEMIALQLSRYVGKRPIVAANFASTDQEVIITVLGAVSQAGTYRVAPEGSLQSAVAKAGGFLSVADLKQIKIKRHVDGKIEDYGFNLEEIMAKADVALLPRLQNGDMIIVPGAFDVRTVKILGTIRRPGEYQLHGEAGLLDLLAMAGGTDRTADLSRVRVISKHETPAQNVFWDIRYVMGRGQNGHLPDLADGDIVIIPEQRGKNIWRGIVSSARDLTAIATLALFIQRSF